MARYIVKRILLVIPTILAVIFVVFVLFYMLPDSRIRHIPIYGGGDALDSLFTFLNSADNILTKYVRYCFNVLIKLNFGQPGGIQLNMSNGIPRYIGITLSILALGVAATLIAGIPIGVYTAVHKGSKADRIINILTLFFSAIPSYATALVIALVFILYLKILPMMHYFDTPESFIMPTLTIALGGIASVARMTRTSMLEVLRQPYITALRSKGLRENSIIYSHALKNALVPIASMTGGHITQLLCGTFVVEHFFNAPGIGLYMLSSVRSRNHFGVLGCTVVITAFLVIINIITDVSYSLINPYIRLRYKERQH